MQLIAQEISCAMRSIRTPERKERMEIDEKTISELAETIIVMSGLEASKVILDAGAKKGVSDNSLILAMMLLIECHKRACPEAHEKVLKVMDSKFVAEVLGMYNESISWKGDIN